MRPLSRFAAIFLADDTEGSLRIGNYWCRSVRYLGTLAFDYLDWLVSRDEYLILSWADRRSLRLLLLPLFGVRICSIGQGNQSFSKKNLKLEIRYSTEVCALGAGQQGRRRNKQPALPPAYSVALRRYRKRAMAGSGVAQDDRR